MKYIPELTKEHLALVQAMADDANPEVINVDVD